MEQYLTSVELPFKKKKCFYICIMKNKKKRDWLETLSTKSPFGKFCVCKGNAENLSFQ